MARHKEFDPDEVLERAMELFHRQGYEATSMQDLVDYMGIGRGSMYETFGNKQALFRAALDRYIERLVAAWSAQLEDAPQPLEAVRGLVREIAEGACAGGPRVGCMLGNSCVELAPHDSDISSLCAQALIRLERLLVGALRRAQQDGSLPADRNPRAIARMLVTLLQGIGVVGKAPAGRPMIKDAVGQALATLD